MTVADLGWLVPLLSDLVRLATEVVSYLKAKAMSKQTSPPVYISTTAACRRIGCQEHHIRRIFERGLLPEPPRMGMRRILLESDLPVLEKAAREAGYIK